MKDNLQTLMLEATRLTQAGRLSEATGVIQRALSGWAGSESAPGAAASDTVLDGCVFEVEEIAAADRATTALPGRALSARAAGRSRGWAADGAAARSDAAELAGPGEFIAGGAMNASRSLEYKLYIPPHAASGSALPLVVMLHGCTQNPDDFAAGTAMNEFAREQGFFVLYPAQSKSANPQGCWNWFKHTHQQRGRGEPAAIVGLVKQTMNTHHIDARRVYVSGLSAGAAMAAIVVEVYPEVFAAVGVHSGLPAGAASNLSEALGAMKSGGPDAGLSRSPAKARATRPVPVIVFHGDQDPTVHPRNGEQVIAAVLAGHLALASPAGSKRLAAGRVEHGVTAAGRRYTRTVHSDARGAPLAEHWLVHGAGHAWSGGQPAGSYTDAKGPDATREMLRFFFEHPNSP